MEEVDQGLWRLLILSKYKFCNDAWWVASHFYNGSGFWRSILSANADFDQRIQYTVHEGHQVKFWYNEWCGQHVLHSLFPHRSCLDRRQHAMVADYCSSMGGTVVLGFCF